MEIPHYADVRIGVLFFLKNHRPGGINNLVGAGLATVSMSTSYPPIPIVRRLSEYWWDGAVDPWYGDVGAIRSGKYIYAYGHARSNPFVYLARVKVGEVKRLECYEYWNGAGWQREKLQNYGEKEGVFWQVNQGQVVWSNYWNCFLFVYCGVPLLSSRIEGVLPLISTGRQLDEQQSPSEMVCTTRRTLV